ncbi:MAG: LPS-assembly protein LptD, partial [Bacteroidetes bacterium]|nr:LPS-assembly protein LptD [Bacteroidota bacterium]
MKAKVLYTFFIFFLVLSALQSQDAPPIEMEMDTLATDTIPILGDSISMQQFNVPLSKDSMDAPVSYIAEDSMIYDIASQKIYLHGEAVVEYTSIHLSAAYIEFDWETNIVTATGKPDSLGKMAGNPEFKDDSQSFTCKKLQYNFKSGKGIIYDVTTTQNDMFVRGKKSKFISDQSKDTTSAKEDIIYSQNAIFSTCDHPEPHFGVRSKKQKVIPNKMVIVGPSNLEIMGIPTPLWLPFGFFPMSDRKSTGLLFPKDYEYSEQWGFGLRNIGWYFPINDYWDLQMTGDIYVKGTWGLQANARYRKRYKYNGNIVMGYASRRTESNLGEISRNSSMSLRVSHNQDNRAHPNIQFGGSINIQTNNYQSTNRNDARSVLQNTLSSNFSFSKKFPGKPYSFSASFNHSQNTATRNVTINFPTLNFQTTTLYPFKRKNRVGPERWFEKVTLRYKGQAKNRFIAKDTTLFSQKTLEEAQFGAKHDISANTSMRFAKYFNFTPGVTYQEVWNFNHINKEFDPTLELEIDTIYNVDSTEFMEVIDTIDYGTVNIDTLFGFKPARQFTASLGVNTQIFGTIQFKKGWLRGIRHVIKPALSFNYTPDYTDPERGYYDYVQSDVRYPDELDRYSVFQGGLYGQPSSGGKQMSLSYSINNIFEAKTFSKKDSTENKLKLFDNIYVRGNYNFARDSLKFSQVSMSGTTRFLKGMTTLSLNASWDPYDVEVNESGYQTRIDQFYWRNTGKILRFVDASAN